MFLLFYIFDFNYSWDSFFSLLSWIFISLLMCIGMMAFVNYFGYRKSYENFGILSEQIFKKLGFENPKEQDFIMII